MERPRRRGLPLLLAGLLLARAAQAGDGPVDMPSGVRFVGARSRSFEWWVSQAVAEALRRLSDPRCQQLFSDFRDSSGRTLQSRLDEMGMTAQSYLRSLLVLDGDRGAFCQSSGVLAGTRRGGQVIVLCGGRFGRAQFRDPALGAAVILHEELHSLGLGENPPSTLEISERVLSRCAR